MDEPQINNLKCLKNLNGPKTNQRPKDQCIKCKHESKNQLPRTDDLDNPIWMEEMNINHGPKSFKKPYEWMQ